MGFLICLFQCLIPVCLSTLLNELYPPLHSTPKAGQGPLALQEPTLQSDIRQLCLVQTRALALHEASAKQHISQIFLFS